MTGMKIASRRDESNNSTREPSSRRFGHFIQIMYNSHITSLNFWHSPIRRMSAPIRPANGLRPSFAQAGRKEHVVYITIGNIIGNRPVLYYCKRGGTTSMKYVLNAFVRTLRSIVRLLGLSAMAAFIVAGVVALRHMLETPQPLESLDRKSTRLNSSHSQISYAVF